MQNQEERFLRCADIVGNPKHGILPYVPVSRATWYAMVRDGKAPKGIKLSEGVTVWLLSDIQKLIADTVAKSNTEN